MSVLLEEKAYSDVVRESQEIVELALKGLLRQAGVEPPKQHDVGGLLLQFAQRFPHPVQERFPELAKASKYLRKEREFSFYGDEDFVPTEEYSLEDATQAATWAQMAVEVALQVIPWPEEHSQ